MKRCLIGTVVGGASLFLLGYLTYVILMPNRMFDGGAAAAASRSAPNLLQIIVGELLFGYLLSRALTKSGAIASLGSAIITGAIMGGTIALGYSLVIHANTTLIASGGVVFVTITWAIRWAIGGAVLYLVLGREKAATPAAVAAG